MRHKTAITSVLVTAAVLLVLVGATPGAAVEVADQRPSRTQQARLAQLNGELKGFVNRARIRGFAVHAVAGAPNWTSQSRRYLGCRHPLLVRRDTRGAGGRVRPPEQVRPGGLPPHRHAGYQLPGLRPGDGLPNFASDDDPNVNADGSIALVSGEFTYASTSGAACGIVIGQEFGLVDPHKVSFGWVGRAAFRQAAGELVEAYGDPPPFRGVSVNDLNSYEATPE